MMTGLIFAGLLSFFLACVESQGFARDWKDLPLFGLAKLSPFVPLAAYFALRYASYRRHRTYQRRRESGLCPRCGYDLRANNAGRCPECGMWVSVGKRSDQPREAGG